MNIQSSLIWSKTHKFSFYFCFLFFGCNIFPFPINTLPFLDFLVNPIDEFVWNPIIQFFGRTIFGINEITVRPNGSGDTTWNWLQQFSIIVISLLGSLIWFFATKTKKNHENLYYWFKILLRYYLGFTMFVYGIIKFFPLQFGNISTYRLYERLGEMSPMGLLWTFMAHSSGYQMFSGIIEILTGLLLFNRRTTTLGAMIAVGVFANILALNIFYDVPVKIYSFWLLLIGIYLMSDDFNRLFRFFFLNKTTESAESYIFSNNKWFKIGCLTFKYIFIFGNCGLYIYNSWEKSNYLIIPKSAIYGPYKVESFERNMITKLDSLSWQEVFVDRRGSSDIIYVTNELGLRKGVQFTNNEKDKILYMTNYKEKMDTVKYAFNYIQKDSSSLILKGIIKNDTLNVRLVKMNRKDLLLKTRGFHWINEFPFNK